MTLSELREAVTAVAPSRLPEMFAEMQEAFARSCEEDSITPIHMFHRKWAVIVEVERHPEIAHRLHTAEQSLMSDDAQVREAAVREAGEIVRAAHRSIAGELVALGASYQDLHAVAGVRLTGGFQLGVGAVLLSVGRQAGTEHSALQTCYYLLNS
jgi:hypothetical protein